MPSGPPSINVPATSNSAPKSPLQPPPGNFVVLKPKQPGFKGSPPPKAAAVAPQKARPGHGLRVDAPPAGQDEAWNELMRIQGFFLMKNLLLRQNHNHDSV